jgi:hypothetical protein
MSSPTHHRKKKRTDVSHHRHHHGHRNLQPKSNTSLYPNSSSSKHDLHRISNCKYKGTQTDAPYRHRDHHRDVNRHHALSHCRGHFLPSNSLFSDRSNADSSATLSAHYPLVTNPQSRRPQTDSEALKWALRHKTAHCQIPVKNVPSKFLSRRHKSSKRSEGESSSDSSNTSSGSDSLSSNSDLAELLEWAKSTQKKSSRPILVSPPTESSDSENSLSMRHKSRKGKRRHASAKCGGKHKPYQWLSKKEKSKKSETSDSSESDSDVSSGTCGFSTSESTSSKSRQKKKTALHIATKPSTKRSTAKSSESDFSYDESDLSKDESLSISSDEQTSSADENETSNEYDDCQEIDLNLSLSSDANGLFESKSADANRRRSAEKHKLELADADDFLLDLDSDEDGLGISPGVHTGFELHSDEVFDFAPQNNFTGSLLGASFEEEEDVIASNFPPAKASKVSPYEHFGEGSDNFDLDAIRVQFDQEKKESGIDVTNEEEELSEFDPENMTKLLAALGDDSD